MIAASLLSRLDDVPLVFLDVETTGASTRFGDRITELAALRIEGGIVTHAYSQLIDPCRPIWPRVVAITGITNEMVIGQPRFADVAPEIAETLRGAIVVGHNVCFDLAFVAAGFRDAGIAIDSVFDTRKVLDTVRLARRIFGRGGNGLQKLAARLGIVVETAHRALADCHTTASIFREMLEPLGGGRMTLADVILLQGGPCTFCETPAEASAAGSIEAPPEIGLPKELVEALASHTLVRMVYLDARNARSERVIIPLQLGRSGPNRCLRAHCMLRGDQRSFMLNRIVDVQHMTSPQELEVT